jgi:hypothetical protein
VLVTATPREATPAISAGHVVMQVREDAADAIDGVLDE